MSDKSENVTTAYLKNQEYLPNLDESTKYHNDINRPSCIEDDQDSEDNFLRSIEKENVNNETKYFQNYSPDTKSTPKLLRSDLKNCQVKSDREEKERIKTDGKITATPLKKQDNILDEKKSKSKFFNARVNQLDFLLSKASEYSNFIANDLHELQNALTEDARKKVAASNKVIKKDKKRRRSQKDGEANLKCAQEKYAVNAGGAHPIFIQPPSLTRGCKLKDYQLEGVRWLTSLFENGVSGILADEMGLGKTIQVIAMIAHLRSMNVPGPFIVVAPLATLPNWVREFEKWLPSLPVVRYHGSLAEKHFCPRNSTLIFDELLIFQP